MDHLASSSKPRLTLLWLSKYSLAIWIEALQGVCVLELLFRGVLIDITEFSFYVKDETLMYLLYFRSLLVLSTLIKVHSDTQARPHGQIMYWCSYDANTALYTPSPINCF